MRDKSLKLDLHVIIVDYYMVKGTINGVNFTYNWGTEVAPRFHDYTASYAEKEWLKSLLDKYIATEQIREELAITFEKNYMRGGR